MGILLLLFVFTIQMVHTALVYSWYYANKTYVATVLCENKDNKKMHCNGKCYLKKKIGQAGTPSNKQDAVPVKKLEEPSPYILNQVKEIIVYNLEPSINYGLFKVLYHFTYSNVIFHPPTA